MAESKALSEAVLFIVGGETDAPGFKIVPDGHGGFTIVPVPGWNPEQMTELSSALKVVSAAATLKHPEARGILNAATKLVQRELKPLIGDHHGASAVVVLAG